MFCNLCIVYLCSYFLFLIIKKITLYNNKKPRIKHSSFLHLFVQLWYYIQKTSFVFKMLVPQYQYTFISFHFEGSMGSFSIQLLTERLVKLNNSQQCIECILYLGLPHSCTHNQTSSFSVNQFATKCITSNNEITLIWIPYLSTNHEVHLLFLQSCLYKLLLD